MQTPEIDLVIFDCDGVLIDSEIISSRVLIALLEEIGVSVDFEYFERRFLGRSFPKVVEAIRQTFGVSLPDDFKDVYRARLFDAFTTDLQATSGILEVLECLSVPACVATSSTPARVRKSLELTGLAHFFGADVFTASEVKNGKPAPDLFLHVAGKMNVVPEKCLVIEDSIPGIEAGIAAGMPVWRFTGGSHLKGRSQATGQMIPDVPIFDKWPEFFEMLPALRQQRNSNGDNSVRKI
jgi:HAD superfamily hydrolase (TIGR01509 family)